MFTYYKHCNWDKKVKNPSKEDKCDVSIYLKMIYFFSYFAIHSPCIGEKLNTSPLGYSIGVILPVDQLESFITKDGVITISFIVNGNRIYRTFKLKKELYLKLLCANKFYIDISFYLL
jgi:hypothetical protein